MVRETAKGASTSSPRVQRKRLERKEKIIDTSMRLLAEGGLEHVTVGRLAKELDLTPGALYRYFPSMDVLFAHMQKRAIAGLHGRIAEALAPLDDPGLELERIRAASQTYLESTRGSNANELSLVSQMLASPRVLIGNDVASQTAPKLVALLMLVEQLIADAQTSGAIGPGNSRQRAVELWAVLQGAVSLHKLSRFDAALFSAQTVGLGLLENLLIAWGASPSPNKPNKDR